MFLKKHWIKRQFKSFVLQLFFPYILIEHQERIMENILKNVIINDIYVYY